MQKNIFLENVKKKGFFVLKKYIKKKNIESLKKKILHSINDPKKILIAKNLKLAIKENPESIKFFQNKIKYNISDTQIKKGYKSYGKLTNKVLLRDPIQICGNLFTELIKEKTIKLISSKIKNPKIGFIALNCEFRNELPGNDANLIHTDDNSYKNNRDHLLKIAIPIHLKKNDNFEFRQICIHKKKIKGLKQYMRNNEIPDNLKKKIVTPNVKSGDAVIFDPNNFYHFGEKTKYDVRIVLTLVIVDSKNYLKKKAKEIKIKNDIYKLLSNSQKKLCSMLTLC